MSGECLSSAMYGKRWSFSHIGATVHLVFFFAKKHETTQRRQAQLHVRNMKLKTQAFKGLRRALLSKLRKSDINCRVFAC